MPRVSKRVRNIYKGLPKLSQIPVSCVTDKWFPGEPARSSTHATDYPAAFFACALTFAQRLFAAFAIAAARGAALEGVVQFDTFNSMTADAPLLDTEERPATALSDQSQPVCTPATL
jgi:hypothetical protein